MSQQFACLKNAIEKKVNEVDFDVDLLFEWYQIDDTTDIAILKNFWRKIAKKSSVKVGEVKEEIKEEEIKVVEEVPPYFAFNDGEDIKSRLSYIEFFQANPSIYDDLENTEKCVKLIAGHVQSGKSAVLCGMAIYIVKVLRQHVVVVLRNSVADYFQLAKKFKRDGEFGLFDVQMLYGGDTTNKAGNSPCITVCIENETQLKKIANAFEDVPFTLIVDEADAICYKKDIDKVCITQFNRIKDASSQFIAVTATAFDMLYMEKDLMNKNIYKVPVNDMYKGITHSDLSINNLDRSFKFALEKINVTQFSLSVDMENFYGKILDADIYERAIKEEKGDDRFRMDHPVVCLQRTESKVNEQLQTLSAIARHHVFGKEFLVIVFNYDGMFMYHHEYLPEYAGEHQGKLLVGHRYVPDELKVKKYGTKTNKCSIGDVLQALKDCASRGEYVHTHIVIISGNLVGRGLNIVSNDFKYHLTHQILKVSDESTCSDLIQSIRLLGNYNDDIPLNLFCLPKEGVNLKQAHALQQRLFEGADLHDATTSMRNLCDEINVFVGDIPRRKTTRKCRAPTWNMVATREEQYGEIEREIEGGYVATTLNSSRNTKIFKFLRSINPYQVYSGAELKELALNAGYQQPSSIISSMSNPLTTYGCGWIFKQENATYSVREEIQNEWN